MAPPMLVASIDVFSELKKTPKGRQPVGLPFPQPPNPKPRSSTQLDGASSHGVVRMRLLFGIFGVHKAAPVSKGAIS